MINYCTENSKKGGRDDMKIKTFDIKTALKNCMKANLIRLFLKEENAASQDIYKQFMLDNFQEKRRSA